MPDRDDKLNELVAKVDLLTAIILKAQNYAKSDPEVALMQARKSAEAVCRQIFTAEVGEPGNIMLNDLINKLRAKKAIPPRILVPLGTIQAYGNYGAHAQCDNTAIDADYVEACLSALATVTSWYFLEYLGIALPADITGGPKKKRGAGSSVPPTVPTASPLVPRDQTTARLLDGTTVRYLPNSHFEGGAKRVFFTSDFKRVVKLYKTGSGDRNRLERLKAIASRLNPTLEMGKGGGASSPRSAKYFSERFCWPESVVVEPALGVIAPRLPDEFTFGQGRFAGKEKEATWFFSKKLRSLLPEEECGDFIDLLRVCISLSRCIRRLHQAGLCHSDLSPTNILLDFSSGKTLVADVEELVVPNMFSPEVLGTPGYIAPELYATIALDSSDPQHVPPSISTDEHALAVMLYQLLLQRHPLRGPKVLSTASAEEDERLSMGEKALFIENPFDTSNRPDTLFPPYTALGSHIARLVERAFVEGLHSPRSRPSAYEWEAAFVSHFDSVYPCANASCSAKWFFLDTTVSRNFCPFCQTPTTTPTPGVVIQQAYKAIILPLWDGLGLYIWHLSDVYPGEEADRTRLAYIRWHNGEWVLVSEGGALIATQDSPARTLGVEACLSEGLVLTLCKEQIRATVALCRDVSANPVGRTENMLQPNNRIESD